MRNGILNGICKRNKGTGKEAENQELNLQVFPKERNRTKMKAEAEANASIR